MTFGLPISDTSRAGLGFRYQYTKFTPGISLLAQAFEAENGSKYNDFVLSASYTNDTRDKAIFPSKGGLQSFLAEISVPGSDLQYYRLTYRHRQYIPLTSRFVLALNADLGYGAGFGDTSSLPFFQNFFAGGPKTVRGWKQNTLGPRETTLDESPTGGNVKLVGSMEIFAPPPIGGDFEKSLRLGAFFDFGTVWTTDTPTLDNVDLVAPTGVSLSDLRYSAGLSAIWLSPVGALSVSVAYPLNEKEGDDTEVFQFGIGQTF
jgi:outer membrane protein insertion porin family